MYQSWRRDEDEKSRRAAIGLNCFRMGELCTKGRKIVRRAAMAGVVGAVGGKGGEGAVSGDEAWWWGVTFVAEMPSQARSVPRCGMVCIVHT